MCLEIYILRNKKTKNVTPSLCFSHRFWIYINIDNNHQQHHFCCLHVLCVYVLLIVTPSILQHIVSTTFTIVFNSNGGYVQPSLEYQAGATLLGTARQADHFFDCEGHQRYVGRWRLFIVVLY
jgi:hypothetical protein